MTWFCEHSSSADSSVLCTAVCAQVAISAYDSPSKPVLVKIKPAVGEALYCSFGFKNKTVKCVDFLHY
jgi:hypothetical protein